MNKINQYLNDLIEWAESSEPVNHLQFAMNQMKSEIEQRIFNSEKGAKDISGTNAGGYSERYKKVRASKGRQTVKKDFNLTDRLANSLYLEVEEKTDKSNLVIRIRGTRNQLIAGYLTEQTGKLKGTGKIFGASKNELIGRDKVISKLVKDDIEQIGEKYNNG